MRTPDNEKLTRCTDCEENTCTCFCSYAELCEWCKTDDDEDHHTDCPNKPLSEDERNEFAKAGYAQLDHDRLRF